MNSPVNNLLKDTFIRVPVLSHKVLVRVFVTNYKVHEHTDLVTEALIVFFVAFGHYFCELALKRRNSFWVAGKSLNCNLAAHLNQIP